MKQKSEKQLNYSEINGNPEKIQEYLKSYCECLEIQKKKDGQLSVLRLAVFLILAGSVLIGGVAHQWWGWALAIAALIGFVFLIFRHSELKNHQEYLERFIRVHEQYLQRMQGTWQNLPETGREFIDEKDYVSADLDVFGSGSLYQMICTAHTVLGKQRLAQVLCQPAEEIDVLKKRQEAVAELAENNRFSLNLEALSMNCEKAEKPLTMKEIATFPVVLRILSWGYPVLFLLCILGVVLSWWDAGVILIPFFVALATSWTMSGYCAAKTEGLFSDAQSMNVYLNMLETVAVEEFKSGLLKELQQSVTGQEGKEENIIKGLQELDRLLAAYNVRYNPIIHWLLCGICLYDLHLTQRGIAWQRKYGADMETGIQNLGELEMLSSLAVLMRVHQAVFPVMEDSDLPVLRATELVHPLLPAEQAVPNSIDLNHQTIVITGSNMSGKTTFLRTIGLNLILAYAGAPICGQGLQASRMRLFTSMRVTDDVKHGISTFYAEILRIKEMVEYGNQKEPMLCLIDEIFKGTNSSDRIVGAEAVIQRLSADYAITMVSTHDFELCDLADNYHFEEFYDQEGIHFDYQLKKGKCTTTNALYLLKMAGLTENEKN